MLKQITEECTEKETIDLEKFIPKLIDIFELPEGTLKDIEEYIIEENKKTHSRSHA